MQKQDYEQLTLLVGDSPASLSARQAVDVAQTMTVTSGQRCSALLKNCGPLGCLVRMLLGSYQWSNRYKSHEWRAEPLTVSRTRTTTMEYFHDKRKCCSTVSRSNSVTQVTKSSRLLFRLVPRAHPTSECGCLLWGTPNTMDYLPPRSAEALAKHTTKGYRGRKRPSNLREQVDERTMRLWPTPTIHGNYNSKDSSATAGDGLATAVKLWPTPKAQNAKGSGPSRVGGKADLQTAVRMYPTPAATDCVDRTALDPVLTDNGTVRHRNKQGGQSRAGLSQIAKMFATPQSRDYRTGQKKRWENPDKSRNLNDQMGDQLNPDWVDWLMGLPPGWTDVDLDMQLPNHDPHHFDAEPDIPRVAAGIKNRVARITLDGNGVVPQQACPIFAAIAEIERGARP